MALICDYCDRLIMVNGLNIEQRKSFRCFPIKGNPDIQVVDLTQKSTEALRNTEAWKDMRKHLWKRHFGVVGYDAVAKREYGFSSLLMSKDTSSSKITMSNRVDELYMKGFDILTAFEARGGYNKESKDQLVLLDAMENCDDMKMWNDRRSKINVEELMGAMAMMRLPCQSSTGSMEI